MLYILVVGVLWTVVGLALKEDTPTYVIYRADDGSVTGLKMPSKSVCELTAQKINRVNPAAEASCTN